MEKLSDEFRSHPLRYQAPFEYCVANEKIAKGTTDPRVEFISFTVHKS